MTHTNRVLSNTKKVYSVLEIKNSDRSARFIELFLVNSGLTTVSNPDPLHAKLGYGMAWSLGVKWGQ